MMKVCGRGSDCLDLCASVSNVVGEISMGAMAYEGLDKRASSPMLTSTAILIGDVCNIEEDPATSTREVAVDAPRQLA